MSAECPDHGTDLLGTPESGFYCPSCERDRLREALREVIRRCDSVHGGEPKHICEICSPARGALAKAGAA